MSMLDDMEIIEGKASEIRALMNAPSPEKRLADAMKKTKLWNAFISDKENGICQDEYDDPDNFILEVVISFEEFEEYVKDMAAQHDPVHNYDMSGYRELLEA